MHALWVVFAMMRLPGGPFTVGGQSPASDDPRDVASTGVRPGPGEAPPPGRATPPPGAPPIAPPPQPPAPLPASLPREEEARYDVRYGVLGSIGRLTVSAGAVTVAGDGATIVEVRGLGEGSVLGLGKMQRRLAADFDPRTLASRRWEVAHRHGGNDDADELVDRGERGGRNEIRLERRRPGQPEERMTLAFQAPTSDPLGMLWELRTAPPALGASHTSQVLDGLALWRVRTTTVSLDDPVPETGAAAIRVQGDWSPIFYGGETDPERTARRFTLWLDPAGSHLPLRLEVPIGPADLVLALVETRKT